MHGMRATNYSSAERVKGCQRRRVLAIWNRRRIVAYPILFIVVRRDVASLRRLSRATMQSTKAIAESLSNWKSAADGASIEKEPSTAARQTSLALLWQIYSWSMLQR
jgi:hypothetical protein